MGAEVMGGVGDAEVMDVTSGTIIESGMGWPNQAGIENPNGIYTFAVNLITHSAAVVNIRVRVRNGFLQDVVVLGPVLEHGEGVSRTCGNIATCKVYDPSESQELLKTRIFQCQAGQLSSRALGTANRSFAHFATNLDRINAGSVNIAVGGADLATIAVAAGAGNVVAAGAGNAISITPGLVAAGAGN